MIFQSSAASPLVKMKKSLDRTCLQPIYPWYFGYPNTANRYPFPVYLFPVPVITPMVGIQIRNMKMVFNI